MKADPALPCEDEAYGALLGREGSAWHAAAYTHTHTHTRTHTHARMTWHPLHRRVQRAAGSQ